MKGDHRVASIGDDSPSQEHLIPSMGSIERYVADGQLGVYKTMRTSSSTYVVRVMGSFDDPES
jgi:hypothetical protein